MLPTRTLSGNVVRAAASEIAESFCESSYVNAVITPQVHQELLKTAPGQEIEPFPDANLMTEILCNSVQLTGQEASLDVWRSVLCGLFRKHTPQKSYWYTFFEKFMHDLQSHGSF